MGESGPEEWETYKLNDIADEISDRVDNPSKSGFDRFVGLEHLDSGDLTIRRWGSTSDLLSAMKLFRAGDILIGRRNAYLKRASKAEFDGVCSGDAYVVREKMGKIADGLLPIILNSDAFWDYTIAHASGTMSKRAKWRDIGEYSFSLPPMEEQRRIATTLWAAEDCIVKGERFIAAAERAKQVLMRELFSKGIGHGEFQETKGFGKIPIAWNQATLQEEIEIIDCKHVTPEYIENGFPIIRPQNITSGKIDFSEISYVSEVDCDNMNEKQQPRKGDILFSRNASFGIAVFVDIDRKFCIGQDMVLMTAKKSNTNFIYHYLRSDFMEKQISKFSAGSTFLRINVGDIKRLLIPIPPLSEQRQIAGILTRCDETIAAARANVAAAKALKMRLINEMLGEGV